MAVPMCHVNSSKADEKGDRHKNANYQLKGHAVEEKKADETYLRMLRNVSDTLMDARLNIAMTELAVTVTCGRVT